MSQTQNLSKALSADFYDEQCVVCPECGHEYTHLLATEVYQRSEDKATVKVYVDSCEGAGMGMSAHNPSPRRDAVVLKFECEAGHLFDMTFYQHKGNTFTNVAVTTPHIES